jgi:glycosyltransferase involved in cell wall biosynthesis
LKFFKVYILAISEYIRNIYRSLGLKTVDITPGNGIEEVSTIDHVKTYDICYLASPVHVEKGLIDALYIMHKFSCERPNIHYLISGRIDEQQREILTKLIRKLQLEKFLDIKVSISSIPHSQFLNLLSQCKVLLYPTRKDVWPLIIGESLAVGTPVVTYDLPGIKYAYGSCPAVLIAELGNIVKALHYVRNILNMNKTEYEKLIEVAKLCAKTYSWKDVALKEAKAYLTLIYAYTR